MAKRATDDGGMISSGSPADSQDKLMNFAEDLGTYLGTAEKKASEWLGQRQTLVRQLSEFRDKADSLLRSLAGGESPYPKGAIAGRRRGRPPGSGKKGKRGPGRPPKAKNARSGASGKRRGRPPMTAAQKKAHSKKMKAAWAKRKAKGGSQVGNG
jgi:hypothetical protein